MESVGCSHIGRSMRMRTLLTSAGGYESLQVGGRSASYGSTPITNGTQFLISVVGNQHDSGT